jgi:hypothetical protein
VELQERVGHKVEVTGVMIPAGEAKVTTKVESEHGKDTRITEKTDSHIPRFRVISVRQLADSCS